MAKKSVQRPMEPRDQLLKVSPEMEEHLCTTIANYRGDSIVLESAVGAFVLCQHFGLRGVRMMHSPATLKKYQKILGVKFEDYCDLNTPLTRKLRGVRIAEQIGAFWKVVLGTHPVEGKQYADE